VCVIEFDLETSKTRRLAHWGCPAKKKYSKALDF
jgi:hypothetical protein